MCLDIVDIIDINRINTSIAFPAFHAIIYPWAHSLSAAWKIP